VTSPVHLQIMLRKLGVYAGELDGGLGPQSKAAIRLALTARDPAPLSKAAYAASAKRLGVEAAAIQAVVAVESGASGFSGGLPLILPEPHWFSKLTKKQFDAKHPTLSYPSWDKSKYPRSQEGRWDQLLSMVALDVDAGFACASYGKFQILGANFAECGFASSVEFAFANSCDEQCQLFSFERFLTSKNLVQYLRSKNWAEFAKRYNGPSYAVNKYDQRMAAAYRSAVG
jgi:hypothetical protein